MAEEQEEVEKKEAVGKQGLGTGAIIGIIVGALIVQAVIVVVALQFMAPAGPAATTASGQHPAKQTENDEAGEMPQYDETEEEYRGPHTIRHVMQLEDILVNPKGASNRFVSVAVGLEIKSEEEEAEVEKRLVPIRAVIRRVLASKTVQELEAEVNDEKLLAEELKKELRPYFGQVRLYKVYLPKFVIQ